MEGLESNSLWYVCGNKILIKLFPLFDVLTLSIPSILPSLGIRIDLKLLSLCPPLCLKTQKTVINKNC